MLKKIILPAALIGLLTACTPQPAMVEFNGKQVPATTVEEARVLDQNFVTTMCSVLDEDTITQEYVDSLQEIVDTYKVTPPVVTNYDNDWLKFDVLAGSVQKRVDALEPMVGQPVNEDGKAAVKEQCTFIQSALDMAFNDFEDMQ